MLLPSTAPLPHNSETPLSNDWVLRKNLPIAILSAKAAYAKSITDCYTQQSAATGALSPSGSAAATSTSIATPASEGGAVATIGGQPAAAFLSAGNAPGWGPPPVVITDTPDFTVPGQAHVTPRPVCGAANRATRRTAPPPLPQMKMPVYLSPVTSGSVAQGASTAPTPIAAASVPAPVPSAPQYTNLCWALRNGAVVSSQFSAQDFENLQLACSQKGYTGNCPPPASVLAYLQQSNLPMIPVTQQMLDAIPQAPNLTGVTCPQSYQMGGLSGLSPAWGTYGGGGNFGGNPIQSLLSMYPAVAVILAVIAGGIALNEWMKGGR